MGVSQACPPKKHSVRDSKECTSAGFEVFIYVSFLVDIEKTCHYIVVFAEICRWK